MMDYFTINSIAFALVIALLLFLGGEVK